MYNPNQYSNQENQWQATQPPAPYWQPQNAQLHPQQMQNINSQYPDLKNNTSTNQNTQEQFGNLQYSYEYNTQQNAYADPNQQQSDWEKNWRWGDEDNSNIQALHQQNSNITQNTGPQNFGDSFTNDETWNWSLDDAPKLNVQNSGRPMSQQREAEPNVAKLTIDHLSFPGKQNKLETPQWSVESQPSQESSDDILQTSESDKSYMLSRSSTISHSPTSAHDPSPSGNHYFEEVPPKEDVVRSDDNFLGNKEIVSKKETLQTSKPPSQTITPPLNTATPPLSSASALPPPPNISQSFSNEGQNAYRNTLSASHRTTNRFKSTSSSQSEVKELNLLQPFSQSVNLETLPDNSEQPDAVPQAQSSQRSNSLLKASQQWPENSEVPINDRNQYLETGRLSDADVPSFNQYDKNNQQDANDTLPPPGLRRMVLGQMEQSVTRLTNSRSDEPPPGLSRMVLGQTENSFSVVGQSNDDTRQNFDPIEPPEGLHRMVPGESSSPESASRLQLQSSQENDFEPDFNQGSPPLGEPRSATIGADTPPIINPVPTQPSPSTTNRSETIGADTPTPPASKTSQDHSRTSSFNNDNRVGAVGLDAYERKKRDEPPKKQDQSQKSSSDNSHRDPIEGQHTISSLVTSIRNLTVGENTSDDASMKNNYSDKGDKGNSRRESSDSDPDLRETSHRDRYGRRYRDKDELDGKNRVERHDSDPRKEKHERGRHSSPDNYRDKKYSSRRRHEKRYDNDTDYYSDKDKDKRGRGDRDYERNYYSLRKEKDKDRRKRDVRDARDPRDPRDPRDIRDARDYRRNDRDYRRNDYYNRYDEDYMNESRSRPSSRSDSMHESFRERAHEKERLHHDREYRHHQERDRRSRRTRDPFVPYSQGFGYDPYGQYYQQYQYYETLRRTNPQAYAELYRKYYQQTPSQGTFGSEDRASVHSGRSSANDEMLHDRYSQQSYKHSRLPHMGYYYRELQNHTLSDHYDVDDTNSFVNNLNQTTSTINAEDASVVNQRLTPAKFSTAHVKAAISSGKFIRILPNYPLDGQPATVELCSLESLFVNDEDYRELALFPGPLAKGVTHKKTIIEYCESKIKSATYSSNIVDPESYILLWEFLILLIRQNGMVIGTDIAELLLKNRQTDLVQRPSSALSATSSNAAEVNISEASNLHASEATNGSMMSVLKEEEVTNKFREYLLYGSCKEALEWAMKHGLWGHALFLATKLDKRTYANVMMRFANGLTLNDPLQTLYQLLSGRTPACVTCVADEKWGDWRPHLAMILSNTTQRPELNCKAVTAMGDTLMSRGSLYAAQFCYLMAETGFGSYGNETSRLVLLGADLNKDFNHFATNETIHMTEIYEYACSLNDAAFTIPELQIYKYLVATRLADYGMLEKSLAYLEKIAIHLVQNPNNVNVNLANNVYVLADKLKYQDMVSDVEDVEFDENGYSNRPDCSWLRDLKNVYNNYGANLLNTYNTTTDVTQASVATYDSSNILQDAWQQQQMSEQYQQQQVDQQWPNKQQETSLEPQQMNDYQQQHVEQDVYPDTYQSQQMYWTNQSQWDQTNQYAQNDTHQEDENQVQSYGGLNAQTEPAEVQKQASEEVRPQISLPNQSKRGDLFGEDESTGKQQSQASAKSKAEKQQQQDKSTSSGWFGGIFSRLAPKPRNQMKLPDDKNPTIIWDPVKKRWINNEDDSVNGTTQLQPPPKMSELMPKIQSQPNPAPAEIPTMPGMIQQSQLETNSSVSDDGLKKSNQPNMFKLQSRSRNLKKSYVDVFNPSGKTGMQPGADLNAGSVPQMNFFIPQPVNDPNAPVNFLTSTSAPLQPLDDTSQVGH